MKQHQKFRWYTLVGMAFFVVAPLAAFGLGIAAQRVVLDGNVTLPVIVTTPSVDIHLDWQLYTNTKYGVSLRYPSEFDARVPQTPSDAAAWSFNSNTPGTLLLDIVMPRTFEPKTNFVDGTVRIGVSRDPQALAGCLQAPNDGGATTTQSIHAAQFILFHTSDAGAGNRYDSTGYRTMRDGTCYGIDLVSHWSELLNYPPELGLHEFDHARVERALNDVLQTLTLTSPAP